MLVWNFGATPHVTFMWCLCDACVKLMWCLCDACTILVWCFLWHLCDNFVQLMSLSCGLVYCLSDTCVMLMWSLQNYSVHLKKHFLTFMWRLCDACVMFTWQYVKHLYVIHAMLVRWSCDACATFICHFSDAGVTFAGSLFIVSQSVVSVSLLIFFLTTKKWERVKHGHTNIETKHSTT